MHNHHAKSVLLACAFIFFVASVSDGQEFSRLRTSVNQAASNSRIQFGEDQFEEYERQLNAILLTRIDAESEFVGEIVDRVRTGALPPRLVQTTFQWIRIRRPDTRYPFVYFEKVLRLQATRLALGEEIPAFDYTVYLREISNGSNTSRRQFER